MVAQAAVEQEATDTVAQVGEVVESPSEQPATEAPVVEQSSSSDAPASDVPPEAAGDNRSGAEHSAVDSAPLQAVEESADQGPAASASDEPAAARQPATDQGGTDVPRDEAGASEEDASDVGAAHEEGVTAEPAPAEPTGSAAAAQTQAMPARQKTKAKRGPLSAAVTKKEKKRQRLEAAFKDYYDFQESVSRIPPHRVLAINRGERARILRVKIEADTESMAAEAERLLIATDHPHPEFLQRLRPRCFVSTVGSESGAGTAA